MPSAPSEAPLASESRSDEATTTPVYQLTEYYVEGKLDDCTQHWSNFINCMKQKTKFKDVDPEETSSHHPLWTLRTPEEAAAAWNAEFQPGTASPPSANKETVA
ncbi:hypothetical protein F751_1299 [Auxenochlorella protothecoides]|uniref:Uncharacterized protein n=1 Tax=Auxenochlorella protothecoides TaxID=3075 RepID=A0A087SN22_AUXPR|nr:hypothetical protein F751_1299 [Auxenochlorella protothecoides]KFM27126.1 hypothetical protein F751_1299 [Auxenochlorella protothecoides]RMZ55483.1 hypothetical protein APUTEX25_000066 [Auxenochlorella protothecoides]|eukprot:RMZ55483.1 hypothetical protein APUTEX25_000066 [Auxenochlorella protothecoides]